MSEQPLLSILIPTLPSRVSTFLPQLLEILAPQIEGRPVEIVGLLDNKVRTVGEKRNDLLAIARGKFLAFIDDDDRVADDYVASILAAIEQHPDAHCVVFNQVVTIDNGKPKLCRYGVELQYTETAELWTGLPAHTMVWRSEIAKRHQFPSQNCEEDTAWVRRAVVDVDPARQVRIEKTLYFYEFNHSTTETRERRRVRKPSPYEAVEELRCSIVMSTFGKPQHLRRTLDSIYRQTVPFPFEVIVVDDGSPGHDTKETVRSFPKARYLRINRPALYRNPGRARNVGYRTARGEVVICQSDDVMHETPDAIERLVDAVRDDNFVIAAVSNQRIGSDGVPRGPRRVFTSKQDGRPLFFLGALFRRHIYAVGGNDLEFTEPGFEDDWFGKCLVNGLKLTPHFLDDVVGLHQDHPRPSLRAPYGRMEAIFRRKLEAAQAGTGPWSGGPAWGMQYREDQE